MPRTVVNNYGPSGPCTVKLTPKVIEVHMDSDKYDEPFRFERANFDGVVVAGRAYARISTDGTQLYGLRPLNGNFFVRFVKFAHKKDSPPIPRMVDERVGTRRDGKSFKIERHLEMTALVEVVEDEWEGAEVPLNLWYHFREYKSTGMTEQLLGRAKSKVLLDDFLRYGGVNIDEPPLLWSDNLLPELNDRLQAANQVFMLKLDEKGYPESISPAPSSFNKKAVRPAKKAKAKKK